MNLIREAATELDRVRKKYPGLTIKVAVESFGVCIEASFGKRNLEQRVSWSDIEHPQFNVLGMQINDVARSLVGLSRTEA